MRGILVRERVARSVWWRGKEQVVKGPAEHGKMARSVRWRSEEQVVKGPAERERVARSESWKSLRCVRGWRGVSGGAVRSEI